jgi:hypothetical protein
MNHPLGLYTAVAAYPQKLQCRQSRQSAAWQRCFQNAGRLHRLLRLKPMRVSMASFWRRLDLSKLDTVMLGSVLLCASSAAGLAPRWINPVGEILLFLIPSMVLTALAVFPPKPGTVGNVNPPSTGTRQSHASPWNAHQNLIQQGK